jgi:hypothetical protein
MELKLRCQVAERTVQRNVVVDPESRSVGVRSDVVALPTGGRPQARKLRPVRVLRGEPCARFERLGHEVSDRLRHPDGPVGTRLVEACTSLENLPGIQELEPIPHPTEDVRLDVGAFHDQHECLRNDLRSRLTFEFSGCGRQSAGTNG